MQWAYFEAQYSKKNQYDYILIKLKSVTENNTTLRLDILGENLQGW